MGQQSSTCGHSIGAVVGDSVTQYQTYGQWLQQFDSPHFCGMRGHARPGHASGDPGYSSSAEGVTTHRKWWESLAPFLQRNHSVVSARLSLCGGALYNLYFQVISPLQHPFDRRNGINCQGNIAATGVNLTDGNYHAYLLTRQGRRGTVHTRGRSADFATRVEWQPSHAGAGRLIGGHSGSGAA